MNENTSAVFKPVYHADKLADIEATTSKRSFLMLGVNGTQRELLPVNDFLNKEHGKLPVLLGTGIGAGLKKLLESYSGPVAVIDKEKEIEQLTQVYNNLRLHLALPIPKLILHIHVIC